MTRPAWARVEELYHAALERPATEREAFLATACGDDEELRREVQSLLAVERDAERLMEEPALGAATRKLGVVRGTRLGPYEVTELVGAGGMGEVYRARDTRLGRHVAIKVLPEHVAHDPEALARFGREARAVGALSHPHIAALFDIGETDGTHYLVMELLSGDTLAARLGRGALPEKDALQIGAEMAEALGAAHAHGIVHRDVKPANVMLTRAGVKLLDFGLARLQRKAGSPGEAATATTGLDAGVIAGTLPYMAPEQLEGKEADARTDIWALGCVLFEMLTGKKAFEGNSQASLIAAIEKDDVSSVALHRPAASPALDRLVRQCLMKDSTERWQSAQDLALRLREIAESGRDAPASGARSRPWRLVLPALGAAAALLAAGALAGRLWLRPTAVTPAGPVVRSVIELSDGTRLNAGWMDSPGRTELALSPDGTLLVWSAVLIGSEGKSSLYRHRLDTGETAPIPGTEGASQPVFSPDGRWIGFWSDGKLRKAAAEGGVPVDIWTGAPILVTELALRSGGPPKGVFWAPDGRIILRHTALAWGWIPAEGGSPQTLANVGPAREGSRRLPWMLPGGKALLFTTMPQSFSAQASVQALTLTSGERKIVVEDAADARYLPTGHLVFVRQGVLMAAPFDTRRLELTAPPVPALQGVQQSLNTGDGGTNSGAGQFTVSPSGLLAYAAGGVCRDPPNELVFVDRAGHAEPVPGLDRPLVTGQVRFSPDGQFFAFSEKAISGRLWLYDIARRSTRALSRDGSVGWPRWSPDGKRVVVGWAAVGSLNLWSLPVEGDEAWVRLTEGDPMDSPSSWSPDGRVLAFVRGGADILLYRFEDRQTVPFLATGANENSPEFSPDGHWLAYVSDESGRKEVYVTSFPDRKRTLVVSTHGGESPAWEPDGKHLFYRAVSSLDSRLVDPTDRDRIPPLMSVTVTLGATVSLGRPTELFRSVLWGDNGVRDYDIAPDGRRFLFGRLKEPPKPEPPITRLHLVHNWFTELERLAPTRR